MHDYESRADIGRLIAHTQYGYYPEKNYISPCVNHRPGTRLANDIPLSRLAALRLTKIDEVRILKEGSQKRRLNIGSDYQGFGWVLYDDCLMGSACLYHLTCR